MYPCTRGFDTQKKTAVVTDSRNDSERSSPDLLPSKTRKIITKKQLFKVFGNSPKGMQQMKNISIQAKLLKFSNNSKSL